MYGRWPSRRRPRWLDQADFHRTLLSFTARRDRGFRHAKGGGTDQVAGPAFRRKWPWRRDDALSTASAIAPDAKSLQRINSTTDNAVFAYSLPDLRLLGHVFAAGAREIGATADPAPRTELDYVHARGSDRLFVSNSAHDSVSVIDAAAMKPVAVVPVGSVPKRINTLVLR